MSDRELTDGLAAMSPTAIDRFRRMRRLSPDHNRVLDTFLRQNPEKRLTAETSTAPHAKSVKAKTKSTARPKAHARPEKTEDDGYVQLWMRMRAWWDGVEIDQPGQKPDITGGKRKMAVKVDVADETNYRLQVIQHLWGEAITLPGGKTFSLDLLKMAGPKAGMMIADLTVGLGAGARHIAQATGATVVGFDPDPELAEEGQRLLQKNAATPQVSISHLDIEKIDAALEKNKYDIIVARDFLYALNDRKTVLETIAEALKPGGSLIFTDYCLADRSSEEKGVVAWRQTEPHKPTPGTIDEYRELLTALRFDVKSVDDITAKFVPAIQTGWKTIVESLKTGSHSRGYVDSLMLEGSIWLGRSRALESGQLRAVTFHTVMQKGPKRSLTDSMPID